MPDWAERRRFYRPRGYIRGLWHTAKGGQKCTDRTPVNPEHVERTGRPCPQLACKRVAPRRESCELFYLIMGVARRAIATNVAEIRINHLTNQSVE